MKIMKIRKNGRIIRLTESDLKKITMLDKRILREQYKSDSDRHYEMLDKLSNYIEIPYFKDMEGFTIYEKDDQEYILSKIFNTNVFIGDSGYVYNVDDGRKRYFEDDDSETWYIFEDDFE